MHCSVQDCDVTEAQAWHFNDRVCHDCYNWARNHGFIDQLKSAFSGKSAPGTWTKPEPQAKGNAETSKRCIVVGCKGTTSTAREFPENHRTNVRLLMMMILAWNIKGKVCPTCYKWAQNTKQLDKLKETVNAGKEFKRK